MQKDKTFSGKNPHQSYSTSRPPPTLYNVQKLNLCSKTDISKTAWINAWCDIPCLAVIPQGCLSADLATDKYGIWKPKVHNFCALTF